MRRILHIVLAILCFTISFAQQPHKIPFASSGNTIELAVVNESARQVEGVKVAAKDVPSWVHITNTEQLLDQLKPNAEKNAVFTFSIDKTAPVDKEQRLMFTISTPSGETWTKEIAIIVAPPEKFELFQNYPNPFNPTTVFSFVVPISGNVTLKVYNVLGAEVATLIDAEVEAGYHEKVWNAGNVASGVYFYQAIYTNQQGKTSLERKRMMVVK